MEFVKSILRGIGQVMLQNNALTGLLFLAGIFYHSTIMGLGAVTGVLLGTLSAKLFRFEKENIVNGLYGFNSALVGIALTFFFKFSWALFFAIILGSILSTLVMHFMHKRKMMPYTFPFVMVTWVLMFFLTSFERNIFSVLAVSKFDPISSLTMSFGQVMFQESVITGAVFLLAVLINSRTSVLGAIMGALAGVVMGFLLGEPLNSLNAGIFGFNGVLCGIALAVKNKSNYIYILIASVISVLILQVFQAFSLVSLTAPFVFATWITLISKKIIDRGSINNLFKKTYVAGN